LSIVSFLFDHCGSSCDGEMFLSPGVNSHNKHPGPNPDQINNDFFTERHCVCPIICSLDDAACVCRCVHSLHSQTTRRVWFFIPEQSLFYSTQLGVVRFNTTHHTLVSLLLLQQQSSPSCCVCSSKVTW
jgi:hypothetical protein